MTAFILAASWTNHGYADAPAGRYTISNGTVLDTQTKLTWQQTISATTFTWDAAKTHCSNLSLNGTGWRLPSMKELQTIVDRSLTNPAIDPTAFPNTPSAFFWTSTPMAASSTMGWRVNFYYGDSSTIDVTAYYSVRCVR